MKQDKLILFLRKEQIRIQNVLKKDIDFRYHGYNSFGVWIAFRCGKCGEEYNTPFNIRDNGRCGKCEKRVYSYQRMIKKKEKINCVISNKGYLQYQDIHIP